jgi:mannosylglycerate hydrolase
VRVHEVTVVPHTHWDREWYQPFAVFRARLVETVDQVLDLLEEDPEFTHFMLDGQAVVLDDYLALKPESEARISRLVREGRLAIGPWYTLADEFLSSPEALVRNLLLGGALCRRFGEPMPVVYTPDSFGHISQLPRLVHGFGFDSLVFERGVGDEGESLGGEFRWRTADALHEVLAVHLLTTYSSAAGIGYSDWSHYRDFDPQRAIAHARKALFGGGELIGMEEWLDESLARIPGGSSAYASGENLLLLNGSDHLPPQTDLPRVLELLNAEIPDARFRLGRLREFIDGVLGQAGELPTFQGEFRGSRYHHVLSGVFSARIYLKQANHVAQQSLERYAEPLSAIAHLAGAPYPAAILEGAWKDLLRNHCHDSICGCSIDAVHDEMMPRFAGVVASASYLSGKALAHLSGGHWRVAPAPVIEGRLSAPQVGGRIAPDPAMLTVFNPHPWRWQGVLEAKLPLPAERQPSGVAWVDGTEAPAEIELRQVQAPGDAGRTEPLLGVRWLAQLEPLSATSFRLVGSTDGDRGQLRTGAATVGAVRTGGRILENDLVRLECFEGGLRLLDKGSGAQTIVALRLEDVADAGDEYDFSPLPGDRPISFDVGAGLAAAAMVGEALTGELRTSGEILVPRGLSSDRKRRRGESRLPFELVARLEAFEPFVRLTLRLTNGAFDHRLRLLADCDLESDSVAVEGHFDVLERRITPPEAAGWFQQPSGSEHQRRFLAVGDGSRGIALLNAGLPEYSAAPSQLGTRLAVTLLRSVGWLSRNDLVSRPEGAGPALPTPGAQCLGEHQFELALLPFGGQWDTAGVPAAAERFTLRPTVDATVGAADGGGLLELSGGLLLSALKKAEDGEALIVRVWNPGRSRIDGALDLNRAPRAVHEVDFDEKIRRELPVSARIPLSLAAKEVVSLAISFGGEAAG